MDNSDIRSVYKAAVQYFTKRNKAFSRKQNEAANEIKRRIKRMENDYNRLIKINDLFCESEMPNAHFNEATDTSTFTYNGINQTIRYNRLNPNVPVKVVNSMSFCAYSASDLNVTEDSEGIDDLKMQMEQLLEHFYNNAFRITKLIQKVNNSKAHCSEITIVRNKLIEHPEEGSLYSFGFGSNGPTVKPMHIGKKEWIDIGLIPNTEAFVNYLFEIFSR